MRRQGLLCVWVCLVMLGVSCGPSPVQVSGQWTGTMSDVVNGWDGSFAFTLSQSGENVSGAWTANNNPAIGGPVSGTVDGTVVNIEFRQDLASNCGYKINAGVTGMTTMSGSYQGLNCPAFPTLQGQFSATK
jgi:hypothetical protein